MMQSMTKSDEARKRKAEYDKEYRKRVKINITDPRLKEEKRARKAAYNRMLYATRNSEKQEEVRARKAAYNRMYKARKKEERINKL